MITIEKTFPGTIAYPLERAANNKDENIRDDNKDKKPTIIPNASRTNDITEIGTQKQLNKEENE